MFIDRLELIIGMIKFLLYKILYRNKIHIKKFPRFLKNYSIYLYSNSNLIIGNNVEARKNLTLRCLKNAKLKIGNNVFFNENISIQCKGKIEIGDNTEIGPNVFIIDHDHDYKNNYKEFKVGNIVIGKNVWIGANVVILKGVSIGDNSVVAAGSVLTRNVPANVMFYQKKEDKLKK